eukprot:scaffold65338_cov39-Prasinocladus_malaysianus.AAC.2
MKTPHSSADVGLWAAASQATAAPVERLSWDETAADDFAMFARSTWVAADTLRVGAGRHMIVTCIVASSERQDLKTCQEVSPSASRSQRLLPAKQLAKRNPGQYCDHHAFYNTEFGRINHFVEPRKCCGRALILFLRHCNKLRYSL